MYRGCSSSTTCGLVWFGLVWFGLVWFGNIVIQNATKGDFGELISPKMNSTVSGNAANNVSTLQVKST
jgi:hypothetical protein